MSSQDDLYEACETGNISDIRKALRNGADINKKDPKTKMDPLDLSSQSVYFGRRNHAAIFLIDKNADLKGRCKACMSGIGVHDPHAKC